MSARYLSLLVLLLALHLTGCSNGESKIYNLSGDGIVEKAEKIMNLSDPEYERRSKLAKTQAIRMVRLLALQATTISTELNAYDDGKKYFNEKTGHLEKGNGWDWLDNVLDSDHRELTRCKSKGQAAEQLLRYWGYCSVNYKLSSLDSNQDGTGLSDILSDFQKPSQSKYDEDYELTEEIIKTARYIYKYLADVNWNHDLFNETMRTQINAFYNLGLYHLDSVEPYQVTSQEFSEIQNEEELYYRRYY